MSKQRTDWSAVPIVFIQAPTCPYCGAVELRSIRSIDQGDDSRMRLAECKVCVMPFKVVIEKFPPDGNPTFPVS